MARAVLDRPAAPARLADHRRGRDRAAPLAWPHRDRRHRGAGARASVLRHVPHRSGSGGSYEVEIRSLENFANSCGCIDHRVNGLGTCKHIEGVLAALRRRGARAFREAAEPEAARVEVFLDRRDAPHPALAWPEASSRRTRRARLAASVSGAGRHARPPEKIAALLAAWEVAPATSGRAFRVSRHFGAWLDRRRGSARATRRARRSLPRSPPAPRASTCCGIRSCPISARACCTSPSASGRFSPTRWGSARPSRRSRPASCWRGARASRACWWSARPRSRRSGRSRSPASPIARRARCSARGRSASPPIAIRRSSPS